MKLRLMDFIVCPSCKKEFTLKAAQIERRAYAPEWLDRIEKFWRVHPYGNPQLDAGQLREKYCTEVMSGELVCGHCQATYPILGGIPRILSAELRTMAGGMGRGNPTTDTRIAKEMDEIPPVAHEADQQLFQKIQLANQSNYGYEWQAFSHQYDVWERVYRECYITEDEKFFRGKLGVDCGCGQARFSLVPVRKGAEMIGIDLSNAIEAAYRNSGDIPAFHAVQGDIFNLPFRDNYFDFGQSLGVIHITPDPPRALQSILTKVKVGAKVFLMVYQTYEEQNLFKHVMLKPVNLLRKLTVKLPSNVLYGLLYAITLCVIAGCYLPSWLLWNVGAKKLSSVLPYNYEQYGYRRWRDFHMNLFDRFGNPVERRYTRQQIEDWMKNSGFQSYHLWSCDSWNVTGINGIGV